MLEKDILKATKAEQKRILDLVKQVAVPEEKVVSKAVKQALKDLTAAIKASAE